MLSVADSARILIIFFVARSELAINAPVCVRASQRPIIFLALYYFLTP